MANFDNQDHDLLTVDGIDHAIPPHPKPERVPARQPHGIDWFWISCEAVYSLQDALDIMAGIALKSFLTEGFNAIL